MGMRIVCAGVPGHVIHLVEKLRGLLREESFQARHRGRVVDFTRRRRLTFPIVMLLVLQKTVKSIQRHLHEFLRELASGEPLTPPGSGAFTHARAKLKHSAFIELNQIVVLPVVYGAEAAAGVQRWKGHRLLGVDSSLARLPNSAALREEFGAVAVANQGGSTGTVYPGGRVSVIYDVLNRIALDCRLESSVLGEVDLAIAQLPCASRGDLLLSDRGFAGYVYLAWHHHLGLDYVVRCSTQSFGAAQELFRQNQAGQSRVAQLRPSSESRAQAKRLGLPMELAVRFVSVRLPDGSLEVLATSLLDEKKYSVKELGELYAKRWGHETFYGLIKGRLDLENFSGQTVEAVRQDFFATMLLCNLESVLTRPASEALKAGSASHEHPKQINRAVSYHALKDQMLDLLWSDRPVAQVIGQLQHLFMAAPGSVRPDRKPPRRPPSFNRSNHYLRRVKKVVF